MTLVPLDFSFPSTITVIIKMEVDQRRIGVEGLEVGVVMTKMILKVEVVGTGDMKKLQRDPPNLLLDNHREAQQWRDTYRLYSTSSLSSALLSLQSSSSSSSSRPLRPAYPPPPTRASASSASPNPPATPLAATTSQCPRKTSAYGPPEIGRRRSIPMPNSSGVFEISGCCPITARSSASPPEPATRWPRCRKWVPGTSRGWSWWSRPRCAHLDEALFPARFVAEMERTVRVRGVCVVVVEECGGDEMRGILRMFKHSVFGIVAESIESFSLNVLKNSRTFLGLNAVKLNQCEWMNGKLCRK
ncbi:hypothetical protein CK203_099740 [Vitis vinifera]|uniref:Uncharacterized protein n=1 Tax=Vitis vinifera TaxID=29760 RepID=A0A438CUD5_VITVI|nr:hypothetical protein CK203_099740 [Vitis vinifera]